MDEETEYKGRSKGPDIIPYNMERDLDRLCLENAIAHFAETGSKNDAFDVYYCYCEIFMPFGERSEASRTLLSLLSAEHQEYTTNAMTTMLKLLKEEEGLPVYRFLFQHNLNI